MGLRLVFFRSVFSRTAERRTGRACWIRSAKLPEHAKGQAAASIVGGPIIGSRSITERSRPVATRRPVAAHGNCRAKRRHPDLAGPLASADARIRKAVSTH